MQALLVADDHPLFRAALGATLQRLYPRAAIYEAGDMPEARTRLEERSEIELVLLDLHMPGSYGLAGLASLRNFYPTVATVIISANERADTIRRALSFGAQGYIPKRATPDEIDAALSAVARGELWAPPTAAGEPAAERTALPAMAKRLSRLTPQQHRVLELVAEGLLNKQIADRLDISERTIKAHVSAILEKLEVGNRTQAGIALRELAVPDPLQVAADEAESPSFED